MTTNQPKVGLSYKVKSQRKGTFKGIVTYIDDTWADVLITNGKASAMLDYNEREAGETIRVRQSLCVFELQ